MSLLGFVSLVGLLVGCQVRTSTCGGDCPAAPRLCSLDDAIADTYLVGGLCPASEQTCAGQTIITTADGAATLVYGSAGELVYATGFITDETSDCAYVASVYQVPVCATPATPFIGCGLDFGALCLLTGGGSATAPVAVDSNLCPASEQTCDGQTIVTAGDGTWTLVYGSDGWLVSATGELDEAGHVCAGTTHAAPPACDAPTTPIPACGSAGSN